MTYKHEAEPNRNAKRSGEHSSQIPPQLRFNSCLVYGKCFRYACRMAPISCIARLLASGSTVCSMSATQPEGSNSELVEVNFPETPVSCISSNWRARRMIETDHVHFRHLGSPRFDTLRLMKCCEGR